MGCWHHSVSIFLSTAQKSWLLMVWGIFSLPFPLSLCLSLQLQRLTTAEYQGVRAGVGFDALADGCVLSPELSTLNVEPSLKTAARFHCHLLWFLTDWHGSWETEAPLTDEWPNQGCSWPYLTNDFGLYPSLRPSSVQTFVFICGFDLKWFPDRLFSRARRRACEVEYAHSYKFCMRCNMQG